MNLPNIITLTRIILAPVFFVLFFLPQWTGVPASVSFPVLVAVFLYIEASDLIDGYLARRRNQVTEIGKTLDPFSDIISRTSYFLAFTVVGIMPPVILLIILYREFGVVFLRMILVKRGLFLAARISGKIKSTIYSCASIMALLVLYFRVSETGSVSAQTLESVQLATVVVFWIAAVISCLSFIDYVLASRRHLISSAQDGR